jgi:peptidoglycan/xylan/chitin deacetylase (PgdA/CDA1 family)
MTTDPAPALEPTRVRIVVFTSNPSHSVRHGIVAIDDAVDGIEWLVLHHVPARPLRQLLRNQWRNLRRHGWRWVSYLAGEVMRRLMGGNHAGAVGDRAPGHELSLDAMLARGRLRVMKVADIHGPQSLAAAREFEPDLGLSLAAPILKRSLFGIPRLGTINLHKGKLPEFRGMPPAFWEMWHDRHEVGCSVHMVDDKLDTGALLGQTSVRRAAHATVRGLQIELDEVAVGLTLRAVRDVLAGTAQPVPQSTEGAATYRKPTLAQEAELRRRLAPRRGAAAAVKALTKDTLAGLMVQAHRAGGLRLCTPRVTVLLYHRVSDEVRDNLTCGIEQFERRMAWLARHCQVIDIAQVLSMTTVPRTSRPLVAVTFDDGYLDNHRFAAPILRRHGVPASFFVATGIVATQRAFPHDDRRGNPPIDKMSWDQLREMRRWGFTIGSHTVDHIDCAAESAQVVQDQLVRSRQRLMDELGLDRVILAYPYGGRQHMTPQRLELVKQAGYVGCLSAYGGTNVGGVDRFNVLRRPDMHAFSDAGFRRMALGLPQ